MDKQKENLDQNKANSRRKFLLGAAKAAPVVTSMAAMPVWASNTSISGNLSGNLSGRTHDVAKFGGCSPGYYGSNGTGSLKNNAAYNTKTFKDLFHSGGAYAAFDDVNVLELIESAGTPKTTPGHPNYLAGYDSFGRGAAYREDARRLVTHYFNATDSGVSCTTAAEFPYPTTDITAFYFKIEDSLAMPTVTYDEANIIFINLEHYGNPS